jgi:CDP-diacylglycerol--glycerol-3-phosphate 3-phosphatidyltransferase
MSLQFENFRAKWSSLFGLILAGATALSSPHWWSAIFLALSMLGGGVAGNNAIPQSTVSKVGATYNSVADRLAEALWSLALFRLGAPLNWVLAWWALIAFQEYARARLGSDGVLEVGRIAPSERLVRASILFAAIMAWQFSFSHGWISAITVAATLLQAVSFVLIVRFAYKRLK